MEKQKLSKVSCSSQLATCPRTLWSFTIISAEVLNDQKNVYLQLSSSTSHSKFETPINSVGGEVMLNFSTAIEVNEFRYVRWFGQEYIQMKLKSKGLLKDRVIAKSDVPLRRLFEYLDWDYLKMNLRSIGWLKDSVTAMSDAPEQIFKHWLKDSSGNSVCALNFSFKWLNDEPPPEEMAKHRVLHSKVSSSSKRNACYWVDNLVKWFVNCNGRG